MSCNGKCVTCGTIGLPGFIGLCSKLLKITLFLHGSKLSWVNDVISLLISIFHTFLKLKTESTRKSSNIYLSWTKIEYQNNLNPIAVFSTLNKR